MGAWKRIPDQLEREFEFADFAAALNFVGRVGEASEAADHHPDILIHSYNKVRIVLTTHSADAVTDADRALAETIDELVAS